MMNSVRVRYVRGNPNHDGNGRFSHGSGSSTGRNDATSAVSAIATRTLGISSLDSTGESESHMGVVGSALRQSYMAGGGSSGGAGEVISRIASKNDLPYLSSVTTPERANKTTAAAATASEKAGGQIAASAKSIEEKIEKWKSSGKVINKQGFEKIAEAHLSLQNAHTVAMTGRGKNELRTLHQKAMLAHKAAYTTNRDAAEDFRTFKIANLKSAMMDAYSAGADSVTGG